ncbi:MAG: alpha/beta hydrolase [Desulfobacteraceae bacterium]|nr:alpha/beta hydrolase [Desulfobacteraceae bacterium]
MGRYDLNTSIAVTKSSFDIYLGDYRFRAERIEMEPATGLNDKPTLVFLHEGLGSIPHWGSFPSSLCAGTGCPGFLYERRGYGSSGRYTGEWPMDYLEEETEILQGVLHGCNVTNPVLIGHSDGGTIALLYAARHSDKLKGVITEAAHIFIEDVTLKGIREAVNVYETSGLKEKLARYHGDKTDAVFRRWANRWLDPAFRDWNVEACLSGITCPLMVIQGKDDEYATLAQVEGIASRVSGPVKPLIIEDCGHVPHHQARERVLKEMTRFIRETL